MAARLWAIDDLNPLRELAGKSAQIAASSAYLFTPAPAIRMQWDTYTDTPFNPDVASAENPPDGAVIDYYLKSPSGGRDQARDLRFRRQAGALLFQQRRLVARLQGERARFLAGAAASVCRRTPACNRFVWDLRYPDPDQLLYTYYGIHVNYFEYTLADHAIPHNTPWHEPQGPMVLPGQYQIVLTVGGQKYRQPITVKLDPRLTYSTQELQRQLDLAQKLAAGMNATYEGYNQAAQLRKEVADRIDQLKQPGKSPDSLAAAEALDQKARWVDRCRRSSSRIRTHEPRPHPPPDRRGSIRFAARKRDRRDLCRYVPGDSRRARSLERSASAGSAETECPARPAIVAAADRTQPASIGAGVW